MHGLALGLLGAECLHWREWATPGEAIGQGYRGTGLGELRWLGPCCTGELGGRIGTLGLGGLLRRWLGLRLVGADSLQRSHVLHDPLERALAGFDLLGHHGAYSVVLATVPHAHLPKRPQILVHERPRVTGCRTGSHVWVVVVRGALRSRIFPAALLLADVVDHGGLGALEGRHGLAVRGDELAERGLFHDLGRAEPWCGVAARVQDRGSLVVVVLSLELAHGRENARALHGWRPSAGARARRTHKGQSRHLTPSTHGETLGTSTKGCEVTGTDELMRCEHCGWVGYGATGHCRKTGHMNLTEVARTSFGWAPLTHLPGHDDAAPGIVYGAGQKRGHSRTLGRYET